MAIINTTILMIFLILTVSKLDKYLKEKNSQKALEMNMNYHIDENDLTIIDKIVDESFNTYIFQNFEKMDTMYIKSDMQNEMVVEVMKLVLLHISPLLRSKLSYIYDPDYIDSMILQKVQMAIVNYSVSVNGSFNEDNNENKK